MFIAAATATVAASAQEEAENSRQFALPHRIII